MVDRDARDKMVLLIRRLVAGRITNDEFEAGLPFGSSDPAVMEVYHRGLWSFYSDLSEHRLVGSHRLSRTARREVARFILFLKSDLNYEWPCRQLWKELLWMLAGLLTLGVAGRLYWPWIGTHGEVRVWPFLRKEDFEQAVRHPCYLAGAK
ncbi:MAG TPA: hypothetical protein VGS07_23275 [Thermoanaerobaculia bacterium]|jgi:hypothetical protein|nr:hypothetical protein [Thermoanaerobaculia bacterium]